VPTAGQKGPGNGLAVLALASGIVLVSCTAKTADAALIRCENTTFEINDLNSWLATCSSGRRNQSGDFAELGLY